MSYLGTLQNLDWTSPSRKFATTVDLFNSQPNYEHEVAITLDTGIKYQGIAPVVGGWAFATGVPIVPPAVPPAVNDSFTKLLLEFDGKEGSRTYPDTNAANWPRIWKTGGFEGFGGTTNVGELFPDGALVLDGKTVFFAPDETRFDFSDGNFTIRGYFRCDFPLGTARMLSGKTNQALPAAKIGMYSIGRLATGEFFAIIDSREIVDHFLLDRFGNQIFDRQGEFVITRFTLGVGEGLHQLQSTTIYSDTINLGWHEFAVTRGGSILAMTMDRVVEDTDSIGIEVVNQVCGPIAISWDGGMFSSMPGWIGRLDRFAIDIGFTRG